MAKKSFRFYSTVILVKTMIKIMRILKRNATNFPGVVALKLCPDILEQLEKPKTIIAITGTNGKTTVSNMIVDALQYNGYSFINNRFGGNIETGIISTLLDKSTLLGKTKYDMAVLEVDERSSNRIYPYIKPDFLVCTNLSRDSFKRNAHTEFIADILNKYIPKETKLILNGDDLISSHIAPENDRVCFGVRWEDGEPSVTDNIIKDIVMCPVCDSPLEYDFVRYNHIGRAKCVKCDFGTLPIDYDVVKRDYLNKNLQIKTPNGDEEYRLVGDNITDSYNMAAAIALLREFGLDKEQVNNAFESVKIVETRFNSEEINGKQLIINLAKGQNPIACSRACDFVRTHDGKKAVIMILEDFYDAKRSTENIAWIHETDFEFLNQDDINQIIVGGKRSSDYMVRLLMAGIPKDKIKCCASETDTPSFLDVDSVDKVFILYDLFNVTSLNSIKEQVKNKLMSGGNIS